MYGMVLNALQQMIVLRLSEASWENIERSLGLVDVPFLSLESYHDEIVFKAVQAASLEMKIPEDVFLQKFGHFWIEFALGTPYGDILRNCGSTLFETLQSLDRMHARIGVSLTELRPPAFSVVQASDKLFLSYQSERWGLTHFVIGLIEGLAQMHNQQIEVTQIGHRSTVEECDVFEVKLVTA
jgi:Haem-NO-binding